MRPGFAESIQIRRCAALVGWDGVVVVVVVVVLAGFRALSSVHPE